MKTLREKSGEVRMPEGPVDSPAAWMGRDLAGSTAWQYRVDGADLADLEAAMASVRRKGLKLIDVRREDFPLPRFSRKLVELRHELREGRGFFLMRGLPVDHHAKEEAALLYWGIGVHLGYPVSQNARGQMLGHVIDLGISSDKRKLSDGKQHDAPFFLHTKIRGYNSNERLTYHVDFADLIGLLCLHPSRSGGESVIVSSIAIHNEVMRRRPDLLPVLYEPFYMDRRGEVPAGKRPYFQIPIFQWVAGKLLSYYSGGHMRSITNFPELPQLEGKQLEAMQLIDDLANDPDLHLQMVLEQGDMQFINNHTVLHSRMGFEDYPEPERKRHLLRLWLVTPDGPELSEWYYERYGAGRRGGIYVPGASEVASLEP